MTQIKNIATDLIFHEISNSTCKWRWHWKGYKAVLSPYHSTSPYFCERFSEWNLNIPKQKRRGQKWRFDMLLHRTFCFSFTTVSIKTIYTLFLLHYPFYFHHSVKLLMHLKTHFCPLLQNSSTFLRQTVYFLLDIMVRYQLSVSSQLAKAVLPLQYFQ